MHYTLYRYGNWAMNTIFFIVNTILASGLFKHFSERVKGLVGSRRQQKAAGGSVLKKSNATKAVFLIILTVLLSFTITSCGAIIYDLIEGGGKGSGEKCSITVSVTYTGDYPVSSAFPIYIAVFEYYFNGNEPDLVYVSDPLLSTSGSYAFNDLEEMSYGVLVFLDRDSNNEPSTGDVYEFYYDREYDPDEIYLNYYSNLTMSFDDTWVWVDGFYENFDDGVANNWSNDGSGRWSFNFSGMDGQYKMSGTYQGNRAYSYYNDDFDDFTYSVEVTQTAGNFYSRRGIIFRSQNPWDLNTGYFSGYVLWINDYGNWGLERWVSGIYTLIGSGTEPYLISDLNYIKITCSGISISISFNGSPVVNENDNAFLNGKVGIFAEDEMSIHNEFLFDNIQLMEVP
jgi:hypothetical protein